MFRLLRYRFFLFAGLLPFFLGAASAYHNFSAFHTLYFFVALAGIVFSVVGVEAFNEYFDARLGTDRVFHLDPKEDIPAGVLVLGSVSFFLAFVVCVYLTWARGWPVLFFSFMGFMAAAFYVGPPVRWAYIGLGEIMIFLSYGPWMTLGSYYVQTGKLGVSPFLASLVPGFLIWSLAIFNEIPDFYQDSLVGKRNLVVRLGRRNAFFLGQSALILTFVLVALGCWMKYFPLWTLLSLAALPFACQTYLRGKGTYDNPRLFIPAVRSALILYLIMGSLFTLSFIIPGTNY